VALAFILSNILRGLLSNDSLITLIVSLIGAIYIGIFIYSILIFVEIDILKFILKKIKISHPVKQKLRLIYCKGISVFVIIFILVGYGIWNARNQVLTNYDIEISKSAAGINSLNVAMISDVHMGLLTRENDITKMVNSINELNPDIVLFCGDIFDESTSRNLKEYSSEAFKNIKSKYGVYAITGNHEYSAGELSETIAYFEAADIKFLQDESIKIENSFYVVGRNDPANKRVTSEERKSLNEILLEADKSLPIIVLNHRPEDLEEAEVAGVDLQLSGHTHKGQIFPGNLVTSYLNEKDYGYLKKDDFNLIVSSGYGTWGPPMRIGSKSEIVNIKVKFNITK
jgi:predicted MPP superfamily phosphohydrolase